MHAGRGFIKVVSIIGARPQFIKAAPLSRALRHVAVEVLVHTGQHYDANMSEVFFNELQIPAPDVHLGIGSGSHGAQTGAMLAAVEQVLLDERPDWTLVYGDTNSTLAGALAAAKLHIPVVHIEAGLRSFNRRMPEEINRVLTDHMAALLFCPSFTAVENLAAEGISAGVHQVGDVMADALLETAMRSGQSQVLNRLNLQEKQYLLVTIHRAENTDDPERLIAILATLAELNEPVVFPVHPRTRKVLENFPPSLTAGKNMHLVEPVGYLDMVSLEKAARLVLTDSGGVQKEAYWLGVPCITMRPETEWVETVALGWNRLVGADSQRILEAVSHFDLPAEHPVLYGDGKAAGRMVNILLKSSG